MHNIINTWSKALSHVGKQRRQKKKTKKKQMPSNSTSDENDNTPKGRKGELEKEREKAWNSKTEPWIMTTIQQCTVPLQCCKLQADLGNTR